MNKQWGNTVETGKSIFGRSYVLMILALISCVLWGSAFPSIKVGYQLFSIKGYDTYGKVLFAGYRFLISSIMIFVFSLLRGNSLKLKVGQGYRMVFLGFLQTTIQYTFFYIGLSNTSGTIGSILSSSSTFFAVMIAHFIYKEDRLNFRKIIGVILGFLGVILANYGGSNINTGFTLTGEVFILISSLAVALGSIYTKTLTEEIAPFAVSGYQLFFGSLFLIFFGLLGNGHSISFTYKGVILLVYLGFISAAAFTLWTILLKYNGVGRVSIYKFTVPIFGTLLSFVFLDEGFPGPIIFVAIILVSIGIIFINREQKNSKETP